MPINYKDYPKDWKEIRKRILERADNKCEECGVRNGAWGMRDVDGVFHEDGFDEVNYMPYEQFCEKYGTKGSGFKVVLTVSHQDHDVKNNADDNLKALCQRCHLRYDKEIHNINRRLNREKKRGQTTLWVTLK